MKLQHCRSQKQSQNNVKHKRQKIHTFVTTSTSITTKEKTNTLQ